MGATNIQDMRIVVYFLIGLAIARVTIFLIEFSGDIRGWFYSRRRKREERKREYKEQCAFEERIKRYGAFGEVIRKRIKGD